GLYITEIVKKLDNGLKEEIPSREERIKWILENQVYACAPSNIIYSIVKNFIFGELNGISTRNLIEADTLKLAVDERLSDSIKELFGDDNLKFDVIIGNPPYQENDNGKRDLGAGKNASASPVYNKFVLSSMKISNIQSFIIPTRWAFGAGKGLKSFTDVMLNDENIQNFVFYQNSKEVFPDNDIKGGVCYFTRNINYIGKSDIIIYLSNNKVIRRQDYLNTSNSGRLIIYNELGSILNKVLMYSEESSIINIMSTLKPYGLRTDFFRNPLKYGVSKTSIKRQDEFDIRVLGLGENQKREYRYINRDEPLTRGLDSIDTWKVFSPYAYGNGTFGERIPEPIIGEPGDIVTETFLRFGNFDNKFEANSLAKYMQTKFFRVLVSILKVTQHSTTTYRYVPDQNFTSNSDIDWTRSIKNVDEQLYKKYNLSKTEIEFIEENVAEIN